MHMEEMDFGFTKWPEELTASRDAAFSITTLTELLHPTLMDGFTIDLETSNTEHLNVQTGWRGSQPDSFWTPQELITSAVRWHPQPIREAGYLQLRPTLATTLFLCLHVSSMPGSQTGFGPRKGSEALPTGGVVPFPRRSGTPAGKLTAAQVDGSG